VTSARGADVCGPGPRRAWRIPSCAWLGRHRVSVVKAEHIDVPQRTDGPVSPTRPSTTEQQGPTGSSPAVDKHARSL